MSIKLSQNLFAKSVDKIMQLNKQYIWDYKVLPLILRKGKND